LAICNYFVTADNGLVIRRGVIKSAKKEIINDRSFFFWHFFGKPVGKPLSIMAAEQKSTKPRTRKSTQGKASKKSGNTNSNSEITTDHDTIRKWVEERGGNPATVKNTSGNGVGILRIDFPGYSGEESLEEISWEDFFAKFDESGLAFLYQEQTSNGGESRFNKFVSREEQANTGEPGKSEMD
jgi:hypothetical protein